MLLWLVGCWMAPPGVQAQDGEEMTYNGGYSQDAPNYAKGKPVTIAHSGGNISVRCLDAQSLSARLKTEVRGFNEATMRAFGDGVGLSLGGDANSGWAKTKVPAKGSGLTYTDVSLTVNIPSGPSAVTVTQTGAGWVEILDCAGAIKVTSGTGGAYVSGKLTSVNVTAPGGDIKVELTADSVLTGASALSAPAGSVTMLLPGSQKAKLTAKAEEVSVAHLVMGTNGPSLVSGDINGGLAGGGVALSLSAKKRVELKQP